MTLEIPVSWGELIDKITILEIKSENISDEKKLLNIKHEMQSLKQTYEEHLPKDKDIETLYRQLKTINQKLWQIEDEIRNCEREKRFDEQFIKLARSVYITNDERSQIKRKMNFLLGSELIEEKGYVSY